MATVERSPKSVSPRFTIELEFVTALANPDYLQHLAAIYPQLVNRQPRDTPDDATRDHDATKFAAYLKYLFEYWRTPEYSQFLTHPGASLRNLELLQIEQFRMDLLNPCLRDRLATMTAQDSTTGAKAVFSNGLTGNTDMVRSPEKMDIVDS